MGFIYLQSAVSAIQVGHVDNIIYKTVSYMLSRQHYLPLFSVNSIKNVRLCPVSTKNVLYYLRIAANHTPQRRNTRKAHDQTSECNAYVYRNRIISI